MVRGIVTRHQMIRMITIVPNGSAAVDCTTQASVYRVSTCTGFQSQALDSFAYSQDCRGYSQDCGGHAGWVWVCASERWAASRCAHRELQCLVCAQGTQRACAVCSTLYYTASKESAAAGASQKTRHGMLC
jgi:hypothetical protein